MIITKQGFIGPAPPILFGDKYVNVVDHTTCLGLTIDNCLSWSKHGFLVSKETVMLRRWGRSKQKFGFIKRVDKC